MKLQKPAKIAIIIAILAVAWIVSGQFGGPSNAQKQEAARTQQSHAKPLTRVEVRESTAHHVKSYLNLKGRTQSSRTVDLRAETQGHIIEVAAERGTRVKAGDLIARIGLDDRLARLAQAEAALEQQVLLFEASQKLLAEGFQSTTDHAQTVALYKEAQATLKKIQLDIEKTEIVAPFDGLLDARTAEVGDYLKIGDNIATIIDLNPLYVVGDITEKDRAAVFIDQPATLKLITGQELVGKVHYISNTANPLTRTFRLEVEAINNDYAVADGITTDIKLPKGSVLAHEISPAILSLSDAGIVGVKIVTPANMVQFVPVEIVDDNGSLWISGLPEKVRLITLGQEFVKEGALIDPVTKEH